MAEETAKGAAVGAGVGLGIWGLAVPVANAIGFTASGIAGGSTAAAMMSAAAVANGGGVAASSAVAMLQSVGAVGLATPVGMGLVAAGVAVGGVAMGVKALLSTRSTDGEDKQDDDSGGATGNDSWSLIEWSSSATKPLQSYFANEREAREAFTSSPALKKVLLGPDMTCVESMEI